MHDEKKPPETPEVFKKALTEPLTINNYDPPEPKNSGQCFLNVDGTVMVDKNGCPTLLPHSTTPPWDAVRELRDPERYYHNVDGKLMLDEDGRPMLIPSEPIKLEKSLNLIKGTDKD